MTTVCDVMDDLRAMAAVKAALAEDVGEGDATTLALVDPAARATGEILAREACRVAGGDGGACGADLCRSCVARGGHRAGWRDG